MNFAHPLFLIPLGMGALHIIIGAISLKFPPKTANSIFGYRTSKSMQSHERWVFAQAYSAKESLKWGFALLPISALGMIDLIRPFPGMIVGLSAMMASFALIMIRTEKAITSKFKENQKD